jgi:hypothetical protein
VIEESMGPLIFAAIKLKINNPLKLQMINNLQIIAVPSVLSTVTGNFS